MQKVRGFAAILVLALMMCFSILPVTAHASEAPQQVSSGSYEAIRARIREINDAYDLYEPMSEEDAKFIQTYASSMSTVQTRGSSGFNWTKSADGTTVNVSGNVYHNGTFSYTWGANMSVSTTSGSTPRSMVAKVRCVGYGVSGSGYGKIYDRTLSRTWTNTRSFFYGPSASYSAVSAVYTVDAWVDVTTSGGSFFTVNG